MTPEAQKERDAVVAHPAKTKAQQRVLDQIGIGNHSPIMQDRTRDAMLASGLIVELGPIVLGGHLPVKVDHFDMPISVHREWCEYQAAEYDRQHIQEKADE